MERKATSTDAFSIPGSAAGSRERLDFSTPRKSEVSATPIKRTAPRPHAISESPGLGEDAHSRKKVSIYQRLGWDDDFDDL